MSPAYIEADKSPLDDFLTTSQAAERVDTSVRTIHRLIAAGNLGVDSIGNKKLMRRSELLDVWHKQPQKGTGHGSDQLRLEYWKAFSNLLNWQERFSKLHTQSIDPRPQSWFAITL